MLIIGIIHCSRCHYKDTQKDTHLDDLKRKSWDEHVRWSPNCLGIPHLVAYQLVEPPIFDGPVA